MTPTAAALAVTAMLSPIGAPSSDDIAAPWWRDPVGAPPAAPAVAGSDWVRSPIDAFVLAELQRRGLDPAPDASRRTWIRRVTLELTGLPPTPDEVDAFLVDDGDDAHERVVDRLLASPRYGERWGRHWLDVARYADTSGDGTDMPIPEAALYRDYVIDALNDDLPYDEFLVEQIAGDLLVEEDPSTRLRERRVATGYIALSRRFGNGTYSGMNLVIDNTIETIGEGLLAQSVQCARCHDHKFDPIGVDDYFGWYGYFQNTRYPHAGSEHGRERLWFLSLDDDADAFEAHREREARKVALIARNKDLVGDFGERDKLGKKVGAKRRELEALLFELAASSPPDTGAIERASSLSAEVDRLASALEELAAGEDELAALHARDDGDVAWGVQDFLDVGGDVRVHVRGDPDEPGDVAPRGFLRAWTDDVPRIPAGKSGRLAFARWIASAVNPLTSRVMANRIWLGHFGRGLVATPNVFGSRGEPPTHPELLDWLAATFIERGWSMKALHREIVLSSTYRQASRASEASIALDPDAAWLSRYPSRRMDAETLRDALLAVSGRLDLSRPGPHPFPRGARFTQHHPFTADYEHDHRSVYLMRRRLGTAQLFCLFDGPDANRATGERATSTVPQQALFLMNGDLLRQSAGALAERLLSMETDDPVGAAFRLLFQRSPDDRERVDVEAHLAAIDDGDRLTAWTSLCRALLSSNEFCHLE